MSRYRPLPIPVITKPSLENLNPDFLMKQIKRDADEIVLLEKLHYQLSNHPTGIVTSSEQLMIKSTIKTIVGNQSVLNLSMEAIRVTSNFNLSISLEGIGDMLKSAVEGLVKKIKQFVDWLVGLVKRVFSGNDRKARECEEAERKVKDFKEAARRAEEEARNNRAKENEYLRKKAEEEKNKKEQEHRAYEDRVNTLDSTHTRIYQGGAGSGLEFIIRRSAQYPFKTPDEFKAFLNVVNNGILKTLSETITVGKFKEGEGSNVFRKMKKTTQFDKFFEEVAHSNDVSVFKMIRVDSEGDDYLRYKAVDLSWMLLGCANTLRGLPNFIKRCEDANKRLIIELNTRKFYKTEEEFEKNQTEIVSIREWLAVNASLTRLLVDINRTVVHIADEALAAFNELVK